MAQKKEKLIIDQTLRSVVRDLSESQRIGLRQSLESIGCTDPIILWDNIIVDGIERYQICQELHINFETKSIEFKNKAEAAKFRIERHKNRRQMNAVNRIEAALELFEGELSEQARKNQLEGAKKGGQTKTDSDGKAYQTFDKGSKEEKTWVNNQIAQLADSNHTYVSFIRNLRNKAETEPQAKIILFKLRRGEVSIGAVIGKKSRNASKGKTKASKKSKGTDPKEQTLLEKHGSDTWGWNVAQEQMKYENLKDAVESLESQLFDSDKILEIVIPYCKEDKSYDMVARLLPLFEICYRIGFVKGIKETSEDAAKNEFYQRDFDITTQFRRWIKEQEEHLEVTKKGSHNGMAA